MTRLVVNGAGEKENAGLLNHGFAKLKDVLLGLEFNEANGAGVGRSPGKELFVAGKEFGEEMEIAENELAVAVDDDVAVTKGEVGEELAGSAAADGGVVLEIGARLENFGIAGSEPAEAQAGKAIGFADGAETDSAVIEIAGGGQACRGIVLELAVNFVGENVDAAIGSEVKNTF